MVPRRTRIVRSFRCAIVVLSLLLPEAAAWSQEGNAPSHSLRSGAWALDFGVQPGFAGFSSTAGIAVKHHLSDRFAMRLGGTVAIDERESDGFRREVAPGYAPIEFDAANDFDLREYTAFLHLQPHVVVEDRTTIYLYGGPVAVWARTTEDQWETLPDGSQFRYSRDYEVWYAGLEVGAGFEWFWTRRVSLGAYYGLSGMYGEFDRDEQYYSSQYVPPLEVVRVDSGRAFTVRTRGSFFKIAAYF